MPISLQERMTLRAISPRFATSIFLNIFLVASPYFEAARYCACASRRARIRSAHGLSRADGEKPFAILDRLTVFHQDTDDLTRHLRFDFVHEFHCLDDADNGTFFDEIADRYESLGGGSRRFIEGTDDRRLDIDEIFFSLKRGGHDRQS